MSTTINELRKLEMSKVGSWSGRNDIAQEWYNLVNLNL